MKAERLLLVLLSGLLVISIPVHSRPVVGDFVIVAWRVDIDGDGKVILLPQVRILDEGVNSSILKIRVRNNYDAWYEVLVRPLGSIISASSLPHNFVLPPGGRRDFDAVAFGPGESLALIADGTSPIAETFLIVDLLWRLFVGSAFPQNLCDILLQSMDVLLPISDFVAQLSLDIQNRDIPEILWDLGKIPTIPQIPQVLKAIALLGSNELAAKKIEKIASGLIPWLKIMLKAGRIVELELQTLLAPRSDALVFEATLIRKKPQAPAGLQAVGGSFSTIELNWEDRSNNEEGFKIYRDGNFIAQVGHQINYIDTGLAPETRYCYQVSAFNSAGESNLSNRACARTPSKPNNPPIANAGPDQTVQVGSTVQLDGSGSSDPDGDPLTFYWRFISRPRGSRARLSNDRIPNPTFIADKEGEYLLELRVQDSKRARASDQVKIITKVTPPQFIQIHDLVDDFDSPACGMLSSYMRAVTDGKHVVWSASDAGYNQGGREIWLYDIQARNKLKITENNNLNLYPQLSDNYIVWLSSPFPAGCSITLYNIIIGTAETIAESCGYPRIDNHYVIWCEWSSSKKLYLYNIYNKQLLEIANNCEYSAAISNGVVVWSGFDGHDQEIFVYDAARQTTQQITDNECDDWAPEIDGNFIVWSRGGSCPEPEGTGLYSYNLTTGEIVRLTTSEFPDSFKISEGFISWCDFEGLHLFEIASRSEILVNDSCQFFDMADKKIAFGDYDEIGQDWEVSLYDISSKRKILITDNQLEDNVPSVGGDYITWFQCVPHGSTIRWSLWLMTPMVNFQPLMYNSSEDESLKDRKVISEIKAVSLADERMIHFIVEKEEGSDFRIQIFDLSGRFVFNTDWLEGNTFNWQLTNNQGHPLANGIYLYVITVRGYDGQVIRSPVKKLVVLR